MAKKAAPAKPVKAAKATKAIKKEAPKKDAPKKVAPKKEAKGAKKEAKPPVLAKTPSKKEETKENGGANKLDLCLLLDCTGSMESWIQRSKDTLKEIIDTVKKDNPALQVRVCFVGYRDIRDHYRFSLMDFSDDLAAVKTFIGGVTANGGGDFPEDVQGGFN